MLFVEVAAKDKAVERLGAVQHADIDEEVEGAVHGRRGGVAAQFFQVFQDFVGFDDVGVGQDQFEDLAADRGQAHAAFDAVLFDVGDGGGDLSFVHDVVVFYF